MDTSIYCCRTDGCVREGQPGVARWCQACGLPTVPDPGAAASALPMGGQPAGGAAAVAAPPVAGLHGPTSGAVALAVVVALTAIVLIATKGLYGGWGSRASAGYGSYGRAAPYSYSEPDSEQPVAPLETIAEPPTTQWSTSTEPVPTEPPATSPPVPEELTGSVSASASATAEDNVDAAGTVTTYAASNVLDGDPSTGWRTRGDGEGVTLMLALPWRRHLTEVGLIPGYAKVDPTNGRDRFPEERRIRTVRWRFDDGTTVEQELADEPTMQRQAVDVTTTSVVIEIVATTEPGDDRYDYTAISDVSLLGMEAE